MDLEEIFINKCIIDSRQSRLILELKSPKKRNMGIWRFAHDVDFLLREQCIFKVTNASVFPSDFLRGDVWAIYLYDSGGKLMNEQEATRMIGKDNGPIILVSSAGHAVIKGEDNKLYLLTFKMK